MQDIINFTNCKQFGGEARFDENNEIQRLTLKIQYNGLCYKLRFGPHYFYHCISEYLGCSIYSALGIPAQKVLLGIYECAGEKLPAVACQCFNVDNLYLMTMDEILYEQQNTDFGENILNEVCALEQQQDFDAHELKQRFWQMFVVDAYIGVEKRLEDNWGCLFDRSTNRIIGLAPVFNCCSGFCSDRLDKDAEFKKIFLGQKIDSWFSLYDDTGYTIDNKPVSYFEFLSRTNNIDCLTALAEITKKIDKIDVNKIIDGIELLSKLEKSNFNKYLTLRKELILKKTQQINSTYRMLVKN